MPINVLTPYSQKPKSSQASVLLTCWYSRCEEPNQAPIDDDLVSSLRTELERCLRSNREKRAELTELKGRVKTLTSEMEKVKGQLSEFEKTCSDQKVSLIFVVCFFVCFVFF